MIMRIALQELLLEYEPQSEEEEIHLKKMQTVVDNKNCLFSHFFSPGHFTSSAFVLSPDEQSIALIFHPLFQLWIQPGGHLDDTDRSIREAAIREVMEEISLKSVCTVEWSPSILDLDIHQVPFNPYKKQPPHEHYDVRFLFRAPTWEISPANEIKQVQWVQLKDIHTVQTDASVRNGVKRILERQHR
jgi:ADP-ribose pyrophosphatase YjhB (NUDIX family)